MLRPLSQVCAIIGLAHGVKGTALSTVSQTFANICRTSFSSIQVTRYATCVPPPAAPAVP